MHVAKTGTAVRRRAPLPGGPTAEALIAPGVSEQVAVVHVEIPPGGCLPEHDHGSSQIVLVPLSGTVELSHDGESRTLVAGSVAHIATGERVALANPGTEPASLMVVASPPQFAERLASWPAA
ncbi:cupin domain-containing protein [Streptomyces sp. B21-083]|uniref:cupin domain-containing protein n=1 Tax=Streptomyces sp. B21-083 TaxID=3039410 RepID=UPI002FEEE8E0